MADEWPNSLLEYDTQLAFDLSPSNFPPVQREWYQRLTERLGCSFHDAVLYHTAMHVATLRGPLKGEEDLAGFFPKESPQNREVLLGIVEKVFAGEEFPDF